MIKEDTTIRGGMDYNKATLAFPEKNETRFLEKCYTDSLIQFRIAFLLVNVLYAAFGYHRTAWVDCCHQRPKQQKVICSQRKVVLQVNATSSNNFPSDL